MKILSADFVISAVLPAQFPKDRKPHIAFAGRSNVGKSSLINALLHRKNLVKTSATPGKTQLINFFLINSAFYFTDLPGYGYARVPRAVTETWAPMVEGYLKGTSDLKAVVVLLDCRRPPDERDRQMVLWLRQQDIPAIFTLTKMDKLNRQEAEHAQKMVNSVLDISGIPTSAKSGLGIKELWGEIRRHLDAE
jgi:GTP-binding protein